MMAVYATATELQNNFSKYRKMALEGKEIIITVNGREELKMKKNSNDDWSWQDYSDTLVGSRLKSSKDVWGDKYKKYKKTGRV